MESDRIGWRDAPVGRQGAHAGRCRMQYPTRPARANRSKQPSKIP